ncbi:thioredoxin 2 [Euphorbia peplus]|nr:thioredoxin 2 [Euphorbia peplus]
MGGIISGLMGGDAAAAAAGSSFDEGSSGVTCFHSPQEWHLHFNSLKDSNQLMVIDFTATWCGPCKFMEPQVKIMANRFSDVSFAKIDVDKLPEVSQEFGAQSIPTFVLVKKGKEVDRVVGAKKDELLNKVEKHRSF